MALNLNFADAEEVEHAGEGSHEAHGSKILESVESPFRIRNKRRYLQQQQSAENPPSNRQSARFETMFDTFQRAEEGDSLGASPAASPQLCGQKTTSGHGI